MHHCPWALLMLMPARMIPHHMQHPHTPAHLQFLTTCNTPKPPPSPSIPSHMPPPPTHTPAPPGCAQTHWPHRRRCPPRRHRCRCSPTHCRCRPSRRRCRCRCYCRCCRLWCQRRLLR
eukprot:351320-Chlamydomonas_euryale.AAC.1